MHARVGDWIVVESARLDGPHREGQVVQLRHPDGSPPYCVRWLDTDSITLAFPGPDALVLPQGEYERLARRQSG
jgi:hypothetical protein